jgi:hypothetical protein
MSRLGSAAFGPPSWHALAYPLRMSVSGVEQRAVMRWAGRRRDDVALLGLKVPWVPVEES